MDPNVHHPEEEVESVTVGDPSQMVVGEQMETVVTTSNPDDQKAGFTTSAADPMLSQGIMQHSEETFRNKENELPEKMVVQQQQQPQQILVSTPIAGLAVSATTHVHHGGASGGELHYGGGSQSPAVHQQMQQQAANAAAIHAIPTRQYLDQTVVPILLQGLSALAKERPQDPVQYLAEFLVRNKDKYGMGVGPTLSSLNGQ